MLFLLCVHMCVGEHVCLCVWTCVCSCVHICSCGSQKAAMDVILRKALYLPFWRWVLHWIWTYCWWGWLTVSLGLDYKRLWSCLVFFCGFWEWNSGPHACAAVSLSLGDAPLFLNTWVWHSPNAGKSQTRPFSRTARFSETKAEKNWSFCAKEVHAFPWKHSGFNILQPSLTKM